MRSTRIRNRAHLSAASRLWAVPSTAASVPVVALEDDRAVVAAEPDVVRERVANRGPERLVDDPQIAFGVGVAVVQGARDGLLRDGLDSREGLERAGGAH